MAPEEYRQFGSVPPGQAVRERPGVYAIALFEGRLLVVETPGGFFLPGGGLEDGERPEEGLRRELREETGYQLVACEALCRAAQFVLERSSGFYFNKLGTFYLVRLGPETGGGAEADHRARWLDARQAAGRLREAAQRWAVRQALARPAE